MSSSTWLTALCSAGMSLLTCACTQLAFLSVNTAASLDSYSQHRNVAYGSTGANTLDIYTPRHAEHCPMVVFFFGGGWNSGDKAWYKFVGAALANAGIIALIPNYTLYPQGKFPAFMHDAAQAVAWARAHASQYGGDPAQLYVMGHSAGAHIAVLLALDDEYLHEAGGSTQWLRGAVGLSGPYDFLPFTQDYLKDLFGPAADFPRSQPINYVRADAPPLLLMHGLQDRRVRPGNTQSLSAAVRAVGGRVKTHYFPGADHSALIAALALPARARLPVLQEIRAFIAGDLANETALTAPAAPGQLAAAPRSPAVSPRRPPGNNPAAADGNPGAAVYAR